MLISIARPKTFALGNMRNSDIYRSIDQYPNAEHIPSILIVQIDRPIYFANSNYLRERYHRIVLLMRNIYEYIRDQQKEPLVVINTTEHF